MFFCWYNQQTNKPAIQMLWGHLWVLPILLINTMSEITQREKDLKKINSQNQLHEYSIPSMFSCSHLVMPHNYWLWPLTIFLFGCKIIWNVFADHFLLDSLLRLVWHVVWFVLVGPSHAWLPFSNMLRFRFYFDLPQIRRVNIAWHFSPGVILTLLISMKMRLIDRQMV